MERCPVSSQLRPKVKQVLEKSIGKRQSFDWWESKTSLLGIKKNGKPSIALLQPPTLATFRSWGSSAGASRAGSPARRYNDHLIIYSMLSSNLKIFKILSPGIPAKPRERAHVSPERYKLNSIGPAG